MIRRSDPEALVFRFGTLQGERAWSRHLGDWKRAGPLRTLLTRLRKPGLEVRVTTDNDMSYMDLSLTRMDDGVHVHADLGIEGDAIEDQADWDLTNLDLPVEQPGPHLAICRTYEKIFDQPPGEFTLDISMVARFTVPDFNAVLARMDRAITELESASLAFGARTDAIFKANRALIARSRVPGAAAVRSRAWETMDALASAPSRTVPAMLEMLDLASRYSPLTRPDTRWLADVIEHGLVDEARGILEDAPTSRYRSILGLLSATLTRLDPVGHEIRGPGGPYPDDTDAPPGGDPRPMGDVVAAQMYLALLDVQAAMRASEGGVPSRGGWLDEDALIDRITPGRNLMARRKKYGSPPGPTTTRLEWPMHMVVDELIWGVPGAPAGGQGDGGSEVLQRRLARRRASVDAIAGFFSLRPRDAKLVIDTEDLYLHVHPTGGPCRTRRAHLEVGVAPDGRDIHLSTWIISFWPSEWTEFADDVRPRKKPAMYEASSFDSSIPKFNVASISYQQGNGLAASLHAYPTTVDDLFAQLGDLERELIAVEEAEWATARWHYTGNEGMGLVRHALFELWNDDTRLAPRGRRAWPPSMDTGQWLGRLSTVLAGRASRLRRAPPMRRTPVHDPGVRLQRALDFLALFARGPGLFHVQGDRSLPSGQRLSLSAIDALVVAQDEQGVSSRGGYGVDRGTFVLDLMRETGALV